MTEEHTGGMVALIPSAADQEAIAVRGGDKPDELHLTLIYLGDDVSGMDSSARNRVSAAAAMLAADLEAVHGRIFAHALFNPDGYNEQDPCAVYLVGDCPPLARMRAALEPLTSQEQREPFVPHVTAGYGIPIKRLTYAGPVAFDRIRVAFGGEFVDYPLGEVQEKGSWSELTEAKAAEFAALLEEKLMSPDPRAAKLREYWAHGPGRKKWRNFRTLRRQLAKYVHSPRVLNGLTANIYHLATGTWPGRRGKKELSMENASVVISAEEVKAAMLLADPDAEIPDDLDPDLFADDDDGGEEDEELVTLSPEEEAYEQGIMDGFDWDVTASGELVSEEEDEEDDDDTGEPEAAAQTRGPRATPQPLFD